MMKEASGTGGYQSIGRVEDFTAFPASVEIGQDPYFIIEAESKEDGKVYKLVSAICPHAGGVVKPHGGELICPLHFWSFDMQTGESTNVPGERLECRPLEVRDGQFWVRPEQ
jgi:nitrite reductase/ring-hydroxylating ferredoxin subunit